MMKFNERRSNARFLIISTLLGAVLGVAGCSTLPRNPVPADQLESARIIGMPDHARALDLAPSAPMQRDFAQAVVDARVLTMDDARWLEAQVRGIAATVPGTRVEITGAVDRPPMERTPRNQALWRAVRACGGQLGFALEQGISGGGSDGNTTSLYCATIDGLGAVGDGAHAAHEFMDTDHYPEILFVGRAFEWLAPLQGYIYGDLTLRGITQPVVFNVGIDVLEEGLGDQPDRIFLQGTGQVSRYQFDMHHHRFTIGETVRLCLDVEMAPWDP